MAKELSKVLYINGEYYNVNAVSSDKAASVDWSNVSNKPLYWANIGLQTASSSATEPTFKTVTTSNDITVGGSILLNNGNCNITWNDATWRQRISITDSTNKTDDTFMFSESSDAGSTYPVLAGITGNGLIHSAAGFKNDSLLNNGDDYLLLGGGGTVKKTGDTGINAGALGGTSLTGLLSSFTNDGDNLSLTVGGTTKTVTPAYADYANGADYANSVTNGLYFSSNGNGVVPNDTFISFNGSESLTISYNSVGAAKAVHSHVWTDITDRPSSLPANGGNADTLGGTSLSELFTAFGNDGNSITATIGGTKKTFTPVYASNAGQLGGTSLTGLLSSFTNSGNNLSLTVGGTTKTVTPAYASNAGTLGGTSLSELFTAFGNDGNSITATIGGTKKTFTPAYAAYAANAGNALKIAATCNILGNGGVGHTVAELKAGLITAMSANDSYNLGEYYTIGADAVNNWGDDTHVIVLDAVYSVMKLGGAYGGSKYGQWLLSSYNDIHPCILGRNQDAWSSLHALAFLDDNVASATKLYNKRTLWGQSFDGTGNVDGLLSIHPNSTNNYNEGIRIHSYPYGGWTSLMFCGSDNTGDTGTSTKSWSFHTNDTENSFRLGHNSNSNVFFINSSNNIGIGRTDPAYKLDVNGEIRASGWLRQTGVAGWYNEDYRGGWYMKDDNWVRSYSDKGVYTGGEMQASNIRSNGQAYFDVAQGTAPFTVKSDTAVASLNADMTDGLHIHTDRNNEANKIVRTDGSGYIQCGYINSSSGNEKNSSNPPYIWGVNGSDDYMRTYATSALKVASAGSASKVDNSVTFKKDSSTSTSFNGSAAVTVTYDTVGAAPVNHQSTGTGYGVGTASAYGHLKITDSPDATQTVSSGVAASGASVKAISAQVDGISQTLQITKTLTLTTEWQDTGITGQDFSVLGSGTYIVQIWHNDQNNGFYQTFHSGIMSVFTEGTNGYNNTGIDDYEILLHTAGNHQGGINIYLRITEPLSSDSVPYMKIQIASSATHGAGDYRFKFKKFI
jgi:hypothetical protein